MEALGVVQFWTFLAGVIVIILMPGPNSLFVLKTAMSHGHRPAWFALLAVLLGDGMLILLSYLGVASILLTSPELFRILRYLGAGYLLYMGLMLLWSIRGLMCSWLSRFAVRASDASDASNPAAAVTGVSLSSEVVALGETEEMTTRKALNPEAAALRAFQKALLLSLTNPKAILFLMSFFIQFIDSQFAPSWLPYLVLAVVLEIISLLYLACLIYAGGKLASFFREKVWAQHFGNLLLGVLFTGFAVKLVLSS